jgi:hypothetical protein
VEELLDRALEELGEPEGEREAGVVAAGLQGVDRLPGDAQAVGHRGLRPAAGLPQLPEVVPHRREATAPPTAQPSMPAP